LRGEKHSEGGFRDITPVPNSLVCRTDQGGYQVLDASGQALAYIYARETKAAGDIAKVLTFDEARRIAVNVARLSGFLL
jgi:hypothetical protein